ncbi:unnamed protein product [Lymnaea stagnalis]|uniref:Secreted protein n=1 Tax=Lymnaea stagnalis TaxID=6523 RepID=A0AAV2H601_LYMST
MHSGSLWCFLAISYSAVTTILCQDMVVNCHERIEECKTVAFDEEDPVKRGAAQARCFSSFFCDPAEDATRQELKRRASARSEAHRSRPYYRYSQGSIAPVNKVNSMFVAACLVTVLSLAHF